MTIILLKVTDNYTLSVDECDLVVCDSSSNNILITLPLISVYEGMIFTVYANTVGLLKTVQVTCNGSDSIQNSADTISLLAGGSVSLVSDSRGYWLRI